MSSGTTTRELCLKPLYVRMKVAAFVPQVLYVSDVPRDMAAVKQDGVLVVREACDVLNSEFVLVQNAEGLWNATLMGKYGGRDWGQFKRNSQVQEYIDELAARLGVPRSKIVQEETATGKRQGATTWIHPRLAFRFLGSQSVKFAVWADGVLERYLKGEITTEESKAVQQSMEALLKDGRIKYEQLQKRLTATENELEATKGGNRRLGGLLGSARDKAEELQAKLDKTKKGNTKKSRAEDKFRFAKRLREAIRLYVADRTASSPEAEEGFGKDEVGLPMTIPKFVQALEQEHENSDGLGKDWSLFNETPGHGWNIVPLTQAIDDTQSVEDFCRHTNFVAGYNHSDKKKVLQEIGDEMFAPPVSNKRARRC